MKHKQKDEKVWSPRRPPEMTVLGDHPILRPEKDQTLREDDGFELYSRLGAAYDILRHKSTQTPITIAIYGDWGTGKSSAMRWLMEQLNAWNDQETTVPQDHPKVRSVWFDPWKYHSREEVWRGLIAEVILHCIDVKNLDPKKKDQVAKRIISAAGEFGLFLGRSFLNTLKATSIKAGIIEMAPGQAIDAILSDFKKTDHPEKAYLNEFEETLKQWVHEYILEDERLAIFIDDLDRCLPEVTLEVLEAMKLYLDIPRLAFVVGLDRAVVDSVVTKHYMTHMEDTLGADKARHYLDKLFQVEIDIPPSQAQMEGFLEVQIQRLNAATDNYWSNQLDSASDGQTENGKPLFAAIIEEHIQWLSGSNPREIKRLLNSTLIRGSGAAINDRLQGSKSLRFTQGAQVFLIQKFLSDPKYPETARLLLQNTVQVFFEHWSEFIGQYPNYRKIQKGRLFKQLGETGEPSSSERSGKTDISEPADSAYEVLELEAVIVPKGMSRKLLEEDRLWKLLRIPFSRDVASSVTIIREDIQRSSTPMRSRPSEPKGENTSKPFTGIFEGLHHDARQRIARALDKPIEAVTDGDLPNVKTLDLSKTDISDLLFVSNLKNIQQLNLSDTMVTDISILQNLPNLSYLDLSGTKINDISVLTNLKNIESLNLNKTSVTDISALKDLTKLQWLFLTDTPVSDISALKDLTNLIVVSLANTEIGDISALDNLSKLVALYLNNTKVTDIKALTDLISLQELRLSNTQVTEIYAIRGLSNLGMLDLSNTRISNISALKDITHLQALCLDNTDICDISVLQGLPNLRTLYLSNTQVSNLSVLKSMPQLQWLDLRDTPISDFSIMEGLTNLHRLDLDAKQISEYKRQSLTKKLPKLQFDK